MNDILGRPIGVALSYRPHGAFLPVDRQFPWATPDDLAFVLRAFERRQHRNGGIARPEIVEALHEARTSQLEWHEDQMIASLREGLGWWARVLPSALINRLVDKAMKQYYESTAIWALEMGELYEQVDSLHRRVSSVGRAQAQQLRVLPPRPYGPMINCGSKVACPNSMPLEHLSVPPVGWTVDADLIPRCPEHSETDVVTSPKPKVTTS